MSSIIENEKTEVEQQKQSQAAARVNSCLLQDTSEIKRDSESDDKFFDERISNVASSTSSSVFTEIVEMGRVEESMSNLTIDSTKGNANYCDDVISEANDANGNGKSLSMSTTTEDLYHGTLCEKDSSVEALTDPNLVEKESLPGQCDSESQCNFDQDQDEDYSSCSLSYMGRADIFRPILSNQERKMLGLGSIPHFSSACPSEVSDNEKSVQAVASYSCPRLLSVTGPGVAGASGGGDADQRLSKSNIFRAGSFSSALENSAIGDDVSETNKSDQSSQTASLPSMNESCKSKKRVCFSVCEDPAKENAPRDLGTNSKRFSRPLIRFGKGRKMKRIDEFSEAEQGNSTVVSSNEDNEGNPFFSKTDTFNKFVRSLSVQSLKSKKLETKLQQSMRVAFFDFEAQRASEDWKFRKSVEALDLEYQKKLLNIVENHNSSQKKLQDRFLKRIHKTEKKLKREAQQGRLNEGNCFNVSHSISTFKMQNQS